MPDSLLDMGNGVKMLNPSALVQSDQGGAQNGLATLGLVNQLQNAPLERKKLEIETALKTNDLLNLDVDNALKRAQLTKTEGEERRAQYKVFMDTAKDLPTLYRMDKSVGDTVLQQLYPGANSRLNDDGTFSVEIPNVEKKVVNGVEQEVQTRSSLKFSIDPDKLEPEKKIELEGQYYDRFQKAQPIRDFQQVYPFYKNLKASADLATGPGDLALIFSYNKLLDPGGRVTEGEVMTAKNTPNLSDQVRNAYNKALTDGGPVFGEKGSSARKNFVTAGENFYQNYRSNALVIGKDMVDFAKREKLDPRNVLTPVGDIKEHEFMLSDEDILKKVNGFGAPNGVK